MSDKAILVVDDSSTMRRILINSLARCGFTNVTDAGNGAEALVKCAEKQFDCVFTDWNMPEMDGLELVTKLRSDPKYSKVPIIMVTTEGGKKDIIEALTKGVTSYVVKPFTPETIKTKIDEVMKS